MSLMCDTTALPVPLHSCLGPQSCGMPLPTRSVPANHNVEQYAYSQGLVLLGACVLWGICSQRAAAGGPRRPDGGGAGAGVCRSTHGVPRLRVRQPRTDVVAHHCIQNPLTHSRMHTRSRAFTDTCTSPPSFFPGHGWLPYIAGTRSCATRTPPC